VPADLLDSAVGDLSTRLRRTGPNALGLCKQLVCQIPKMSIEEGFVWTSHRSAEPFNSAEAADGMAAFSGWRPAACVVDR